MLHSLIDFPCLSAILTGNHLISAGKGSGVGINIMCVSVPTVVDRHLLPQYMQSLSALQDQGYKLMFGHYLRNESGRGDTIDRSVHLGIL